jgi:hypothetical protein
VLRHVQHLLVHGVEQGDNEIVGSHRTLLAVEVLQQLQLERIYGYLSSCTLNMTHETNTIGYYACSQAMWVAVGDPTMGLWRHGGVSNALCRALDHPHTAPHRSGRVTEQARRSLAGVWQETTRRRQ